MAIFFLTVGGIILLIGIILALVSGGRDGGVAVGFGLLIATCGVGLIEISNSKQIQKNRTIETDSTQIQFIISAKDENGIWAGENVRLKGATDKCIGDTITIKLLKQADQKHP